MFTDKDLSNLTVKVETPMMKQYYEIKEKHPEAILLFRIGDFYESFAQDAITVSSVLGITLTKRANGAASFVELAGFPYHAIDTYLPKLVRKGYRVAICEQLEDPKKTKTIVKRGVTELITPGMITNENSLVSNENNFLVAMCIREENDKVGGKENFLFGIAILDLSTGEFYTTQGDTGEIGRVLVAYSPKEVICEKSQKGEINTLLENSLGGEVHTYSLDAWAFDGAVNRTKLERQLGVKTLRAFGIEELDFAIIAAGALLQYLEVTAHDRLKHINSIKRVDFKDVVWLDRFTIRNLELFYPLSGEGNSLLSVMDRTKTPMGGRLIRRCMMSPLMDLEAINRRLNVVEAFLLGSKELDKIREKLDTIGDLERLVSKIARRKVLPKELVRLAETTDVLAKIYLEIGEIKGRESLRYIIKEICDLKPLQELICKSLVEDPTNNFGKGDIFRNGLNKELDALRNVSKNGKEYLQKIEEREILRTGISSLKISYNNVFGYYIEVRNTHKDKVPTDWIRKQTLVSAERYITEELKDYEDKILGADSKIIAIESSLYDELLDKITEYLDKIQKEANRVAQIDVLGSFAYIARVNNYVRPELSLEYDTEVLKARHPVIEKGLERMEDYVANDIVFKENSQELLLITGPNMAGKSSLLRQMALINIMAQMGSFVSAQKAKLSLVDKVFTRVGGSDNISKGESTFMVEMIESANIISNATKRSLVLLDEVGRGTSTYDGISIAWAMIEHFVKEGNSPKTLFATHYHELAELEKLYLNVKNFNVTAKEIGENIIFVRKLERGGAEHSFGINVAKLAGMPPMLIARAREILKELESKKKDISLETTDLKIEINNKKVEIFDKDKLIFNKIENIVRLVNINELTPLEAFAILEKIKKIME